ncbi:MAG: cyclic nucleotide-binding protein [Pseudomonadota bacterium]
MFDVASLPNLYDGVGLFGVALYVIAYMGVQTGQIDGNRIGYTCLNGAAAACILFSMMGAFNLASALVNGLFMLFSMVGALRIASQDRRRPPRRVLIRR